MTREILDSHLLRVLRRNLSCKLIYEQRIELRDRAFLVDHLEQVRANLCESFFEVV
jgi:hypothetical protein